MSGFRERFEKELQATHPKPDTVKARVRWWFIRTVARGFANWARQDAIEELREWAEEIDDSESAPILKGQAWLRRGILKKLSEMEGEG